MLVLTRTTNKVNAYVYTFSNITSLPRECKNQTLDLDRLWPSPSPSPSPNTSPNPYQDVHHEWEPEVVVWYELQPCCSLPQSVVDHSHSNICNNSQGKAEMERKWSFVTHLNKNISTVQVLILIDHRKKSTNPTIFYQTYMPIKIQPNGDCGRDPVAMGPSLMQAPL